MADDQKDPAEQEEKQEEAQPEAEASEETQVEETDQTTSKETAEDTDEDKETPQPESPAQEEQTPKETKPVSANLEKISAPLSNSLKGIIEQIEKLSVLELADLVHALEDRFGVSASAPVAVAAGGAVAGAGEPAEEKTTFNVVLSNAGANKIGAIKAVRELVPTLGLKEAKDLVESAPKPVLEGVNKETAEEAKNKLTAAGATVELQ